jgi:hypothetical protein
MYCVKYGVCLPSEAQACANCGEVVNEWPVAPLSDELKTEINTGNTAQSTLPRADPGRSLLQARTLQVTGGVLSAFLMLGSAYGISGRIETVVVAKFDYKAWAEQAVAQGEAAARALRSTPDLPTSNWNAGWRAGVAGLQKSAGRIGQAFLGLDLKDFIARKQAEEEFYARTAPGR